MPHRTKGTQKTPKTNPRSAPSPPPESLPSLKSFPTATTEGFIPAHGGFQNLLSYQKALIVFQATQYFCDRFINPKSRTHDQMVQAARSGKQNIVEGSQLSGTSKEAELKLTNVARGSQQELLEDYHDFMRARKIEEWTPEHPYSRRLRQLNRIENADYATFKKGIEHSRPGHLRQRDCWTHQSDVFSPRPAKRAPRAGFSPRRRPPRTHDPCPPQRPRQTISLPRFSAPSVPSVLLVLFVL